MSEVSDSPTDLFLTPHGLLLIGEGPGPSPWTDPATARRIGAELTKSTAHGLMELATHELNTVLPVVAAWWREFARCFFTRLCHTPDLEQAREIPALPALKAELAQLADHCD